MAVVTGCSQVIILLHYTLISIVNSVPVTLQCDWYRVYYGILKDAAITHPHQRAWNTFPCLVCCAHSELWHSRYTFTNTALGETDVKSFSAKSKLLVKLSLTPWKVTAEQKKQLDALIAEEVQEIQDFYRRYDINRMCTGRKHYVSVKTDEGCTHRQKKVLTVARKKYIRRFLQRSHWKLVLAKFVVCVHWK